MRDAIVIATSKFYSFLNSLVVLLVLLLFQPFRQLPFSELLALLYSVLARCVQCQYFGEFIHVRLVRRNIFDVDFVNEMLQVASNVVLKFENNSQVFS